MRSFKQWILAGLAFSMAFTGALAQEVWTTRNPLTQQKSLQSIVWTGSMYVAVGDAGTIVTSSNGTTWNSQSSGTASNLYSIASSGDGKLVVVGAAGVILTSTNGTSWQVQTPAPKALYSVAWAGTQFVAVGVDGTAMTSATGSSWTTLASPSATTALNGVTYAGGQYVAVGDGGKIFVSATGSAWSGPASSTTNALYSVTSLGGLLVAGGVGGVIRTSSDNGATWQAATSGTSLALSAVGSGSGQFIIVGSSGTILTSSNGTNWTPRTSPSTANLRSIATNGSQTIVVGTGGTILSSTDGINWTQVSSGTTNLNAITSMGGLLVAVGAGGAIWTSTDAVTWTPRASGVTANLTGVASNGSNLLVAVGATGTILTSSNGTTWIPQTSANPTASMSSVTWANSLFMAVGGAGPVQTSPDGVVWTSRSTSATNVFNAVSASGTQFIGVGNAVGTPTAFNIRTSLFSATPNGTNWSTRTSGFTGTLYGIGWTGTMAVAVGASGTIRTSTDNGTTWASPTSPVTGGLYAVATTGSQIVVTGASGTILASSNGSTWTPKTSNVSQGLNAITWNNTLGLLVAVGDGGTIVTSSPVALPPVPVLNSPANGATGVLVSPTLSWGSSSGANLYRVQVSANTGFTPTVYDDSLAGTSVNVPGPLALNSTYYWRVRAKGNTGSSNYSTEASFTTTPAATSAPVGPSPAHNAVGVSVSTSLAWTAFTGATSYHVQFGTDSSFATTLLNDSLTVTSASRILPFTLTQNTRYHWRVKAMGPAGTSAWSSIFSFNTPPPVPGAPALASPADNAFAVSLSPTLSWSAGTGATPTSYRVQLSTDPNFGTTVVNDSLSGTSRAVSGLVLNAVYYWRVRAHNSGGIGPYSVTRTFTTTVSAPAKPTLSSPANLAINVDVFTDVTWQAASGAMSYRLQVSTDSTFTTSLINDSTLTALTRNIGQLANTTVYYWRVTAKNPAGTTTSDRRSFTSGSAPTIVPPAPDLANPSSSIPAQFSTGIAVSNVTFSWNPAATARWYHLQVATDNQFNNKVYDDSGFTGTTRVVPGPLTGSTPHFWRVRAINGVGAGPYSASWTFTTGAVTPAAPALLLPDQYSTGVSTTPTLTWAAVTGATTYRLQVSLNPGFSSFVVNDSTLTTASRAIGPLLENTAYYWRVSAKNSAGTSGFHALAPYQFFTGTAPVPAKPELITPALYAENVATTTALVWGASIGATRYHVQLSTSPTWVSFIVNDSTTTSTTKTGLSLAANTTFYWRVRAINSSGSSDYASSMFVTGQGTAILPKEISLRGIAGDKGSLRFALPENQRVSIRLFGTGGRKLVPNVDKVFDAGYHTIALPPELHGTFYLVEFTAGPYRKIVKIHP